MEGSDVRNHLFEVVDCLFDFGAVGDIVFDLVDEGRIGNAAGVGWRIFAAGRWLVC